MSKKVTEEQLNQLQEMQDRWNKLTKYLGELMYQKRSIDTEIKSVDIEFDRLDSERVQLSQTIQESFGTTGTVNLSTGEFEPD
jgi:chromosome segregation ATPase